MTSQGEDSAQDISISTQLRSHENSALRWLDPAQVRCGSMPSKKSDGEPLGLGGLSESGKCRADQFFGLARAGLDAYAIN